MEEQDKSKLKKIRLGLRTVYYDPKDKEGLRHLNEDLQSTESRVLFDEAKRRERSSESAPVDFETHREGQFSLTYKDGAYTLTRRKN